MKQTVDIATWVRASRAGDEVAWNYLYQSCYVQLYSIALKICGNTPAAKDAVQDAFLMAYLKLSQLKEPATFLGWIKKICIHICYRSLQRNRLNNAVDHIPLESDSWWENELDEKLDSLSKRTRLFEVVAKLPQTLRSALLLRYYTNYQSYDAIARILCIPVGTVRSRLNQAKLKMNEYWSKGGEVNEKYFYEAEDWNRFYLENVGNSHHAVSARDKFLNHLNTDIKFVFTSGKTDYGRKVIEHQIEEDIMHGSCFGEINAISNGNISVVEALNINSVEYPGRCPKSTILVMYRTGKKVTQINLHNSTLPV